MPTRQRSMPALAAEKIMNSSLPIVAGVEGLAHAADLINNQRAMVFLATDFCCDIELVERDHPAANVRGCNLRDVHRGDDQRGAHAETPDHARNDEEPESRSEC